MAIGRSLSDCGFGRPRRKLEVKMERTFSETLLFMMSIIMALNSTANSSFFIKSTRSSGVMQVGLENFSGDLAFQDGFDGFCVSIFWLEEVTRAMLRSDVGNVTLRMEETESGDFRSDNDRI